VSIQRVQTAENYDSRITFQLTDAIVGHCTRQSRRLFYSFYSYILQVPRVNSLTVIPKSN